MIPYNADYGKILSYHPAQDSACPDCAPSYSYQFAPKLVPGRFGSIANSAEILLMEAALERGWIVISPDHEGPHAAYLAAKLSAHAILDGIRATLGASNITGVHQDAVVSLWGYSGGGITTGAAAELHTSYAPELKIVGAAMGGIVPDIANVIKTVNKGPAAGLIAAGVAGLSNQYPAL